jgi:hypothetical protein
MLTTKITIPEEYPIIALSDIHADIDALIIALRDCAKVITRDPERYNGDTYGLDYHDGFCHTNIRLDAGDAFLEHLLNLDLNDPESNEFFDEHCDLGYMWIGGPSHVVIVGDILDGLRYPSTPFRKKCGHDNQLEHQYPQIEVKILKFLNKLDEYAEETKGRVIKLIGNHEGMNFTASQLVGSYAFANTMDETFMTERYYNNLSRRDYFLLGNDGFELFRKRGTAILLIINDIIFVHGNLNNTISYDNIDRINQTLNGTIPIDDAYFKLLFGDVSKKVTSILWDRISGDDQITSKRLTQRDQRHCIMLNKYIEQFCAPGLCNKDNVKLIIGHCPQNDTQQADINTTIGKIIKDSGTVTTYHAESLEDIYTGVQNPAKKTTFGIAMECNRSTPEKKTTNHIIYKVDTGISRGFDNPQVREIISDPRYETRREYFIHSVLSFRTPQVLKIENNLDYIIKSNAINTRRHQPRIWVEELINRFRIDGCGPALGLPPIRPEVAPAASKEQVAQQAEVVPEASKEEVVPAAQQAEVVSVQGGGRYLSYVNYHKYMKYKKKYIEIKKTGKSII